MPVLDCASQETVAASRLEESTQQLVDSAFAEIDRGDDIAQDTQDINAPQDTQDMNAPQDAHPIAREEGAESQPAIPADDSDDDAQFVHIGHMDYDGKFTPGFQ